MEKHYASHDLSLLAKKAGFDEKCFGLYLNSFFYEKSKSITNSIIKDSSWYNESAVVAPELTHLQQWCYEKFGAWITSSECITPYNNSSSAFSTHNITKYFDCPYKTLEAGLMEFLKQKTL